MADAGGGGAGERVGVLAWLEFFFDRSESEKDSSVLMKNAELPIRRSCLIGYRSRLWLLVLVFAPLSLVSLGGGTSVFAEMQRQAVVAALALYVPSSLLLYGVGLWWHGAGTRPCGARSNGDFGRLQLG